MSKNIILVLNAGSSSIKYAIYDASNLCQLERKVIYVPTKDEYEDRFNEILKDVENHGNLVGAGHRVVHGGLDFSTATLIDDNVLEKMRNLTQLAPLHQPFNLDGVNLSIKAFPDVPQVACFDTAFHSNQPELNQLFALPRKLADKGIRKYGFHGISYEYIASELPKYTSNPNGRIIVMHLGNGASACAIKDGKSISSTMGFTALEGLMMGTRCGSIDAGVILHLWDTLGMSAAEVTKLLYKESGILGVSGNSGDMRTLDLDGNKDDKQAFDLFCHMAAKAAGSLAVDIGGIDALVFTAGIGENHAITRKTICDELSFFGIDIDEKANESGESKISANSSKTEVLIIPTDEESMIARHTKHITQSKNSVAA